MVVKSESREGIAVRMIAIHTNEGDHPINSPDHTAENLAGYLDRSNAAGDFKSYHTICDDDSTLIYVDPSQAAWAMPDGGNLPALQLCFTGWAAWQRADWLAHTAMLQRGAIVVRDWALKYNIPIRHLTPAQVYSGWYGLVGHVDWTTSAPNRGTHTDPGSNFPWDVFILLIEGVDLQPDERDALYDVRAQLTGSRSSRPPLYDGWPAHADTSSKPKTLLDYVRALHAEQQVQAATLAEIVGRLPVAKP
jgi:hypothetical protein